MASFNKKFVITTIGANSVTLTPQVGGNSSGPVTGTLPTGDQDVQGGLSTIVINFTGTPDSRLFPVTGLTVEVDLDGGGRG